MTLNIERETEIGLDLPYEHIIKSVIEESINYEKCPYEVEINVILTDNEEIQRINKEFRDVDSPTDVLSFPMIEYDIPSNFEEVEELAVDYFNPDTGELILGDIVISVEKVIEQAEKYGHSCKRELGFLIAHSMMHLFGYDHMKTEEAQIMESKQNEILSILNIHR